MNKLKEKLLSDNDNIYYNHIYFCDDKLIKSEDFDTVKSFKEKILKNFGFKPTKIKSCNIIETLKLLNK